MKPDFVKLIPLTGGFSGSSVFRMETMNKASGLKAVPAVLKISDRIYAEAELANYSRFVKWGLPYIWRVDTLGYGYAKNFGAIAYSFVLSDRARFDALTNYIINGREQTIRNAIEKIFSPNMRRWYGEEMIQEEYSINARYNSRYFRGQNSKELSSSRFIEIVNETFGATSTSVNIQFSQQKYPRPQEYLFGVPRGRFQSCICHGDLNSNNVIIAENDEIIFIDFQETGRGHVFEDFVTMESSIRLHYPQVINDWNEFLKSEINLEEGQQELSSMEPMHRLIYSIRSLARQNFSQETFRNYYYAVAVFNFRLLRAQLTAQQTKKCVCAILAALKHHSKE